MLEVELCGLTLKNPLIAASGTFGFGREFAEFYDLSAWGGISSKGLTLYPRDGNAGIRIAETPAGMMNSIGLQNPGVEAFIAEELPHMKTLGTLIIANVGGSDLSEYNGAIELLEVTDVDMIELNISCPNVKEGGMAFGIKCDTAYSVVRSVRERTQKPLMVKLSPNAENIREMASACVQAGADALSLVNTFNALWIDIYRRKSLFNNVTAGLSGPAIMPIALRMVREVAQQVEVPVVGLGGIMSGSDVIQFIMAGATAVQIGTGNFVNPNLCLVILEEIEAFMSSEGIRDLSEIRGII